MTSEAIMIRIDALVSELEHEGYPTSVILEEMEDYLEIASELDRF